MCDTELLPETVKRDALYRKRITIDKELAEEIYNKVRNYSMLKDKPENGGYFEQIFDNGIIGYFKKSLMEIYGSTVNMDVLTALEKEAKYEKNEYDATRIEQYVKKVIAETRNLSNHLSSVRLVSRKHRLLHVHTVKSWIRRMIHRDLC